MNEVSLKPGIAELEDLFSKFNASRPGNGGATGILGAIPFRRQGFHRPWP